MARPEASSSRDELFPFRLLGSGLVYAWSSCVWDMPLLDAAGRTDVLQGGDLWLISAISTPLACVVLALWGRRRELSAVRGAQAFGVLLAVAGTVAAAGSLASSGTAAFSLAVFAGLATGIAPVILIALWACLFARTDMGVVEVAIPASFVATFVCMFIAPLFSGAAAVAFVAVLPVLSGILLTQSRHLVDAGRFTVQDDPSRTVRLEARTSNVARASLVVFLLYVITCLVEYASHFELSAAVESRTAMVGVLFAILLAAGIVVFARRIDLNAVFKAISIPFTLAVLCVAAETYEGAVLASVLLSAVYTGIEVTILYFIRIAQAGSRTATFYIGIGEGAAYLGVLVGSVLGSGMTSALDAGTFDVHFACLVILAAFVCTSLVVPSRDWAWAMPVALSEGMGGARSAGTARPDACPDESGDADGAPVAENEAPNSAPTANTTIDEAETGTTPRDAVTSSFDERTTGLARAFGLSRRETEVFLLLAHGRSRPYIRDELVLSKNTVDTHIRHIYEKIGVHSQQELIDLVEGKIKT